MIRLAITVAVVVFVATYVARLARTVPTPTKSPEVT